MIERTKNRVEFGDFQTPLGLARRICALLKQREIKPASILEPTCGRGSFLRSALEAFPDVQIAIGVELNDAYLEFAKQEVRQLNSAARIELVRGDFFAMNWAEVLGRLPDPVLIIGNPPWVTNADLGSLESSNLPIKKNEDNLRGIDALTGRSNFDISEWMLRRNIEWLDGRTGSLAVLCKTAVARKVLHQAWRSRRQLFDASTYRIDTFKYFGASVDACLLVAGLAPGCSSSECRDHDALEDSQAANVFGFTRGHLASNIGASQRWAHLETKTAAGWRSGIKHDCKQVFELTREGQKYRNGLGEIVDIEPDVLFPLLKGSQLAGDSVVCPKRWVLVPQRSVGEDTGHLRTSAPKAWEYLENHASLLDRRRSSVYKRSPRFAIFGVGKYSFAPWKVAISGFHKQLRFKVIGSWENRPVVFDDTCYFFPCESEDQAEEVSLLLNSEAAREFLSSFIFWDAKRPITAQILNRLDLARLAHALNRDSEFIASGVGNNGEKRISSCQQAFSFS